MEDDSDFHQCQERRCYRKNILKVVIRHLIPKTAKHQMVALGKASNRRTYSRGKGREGGQLMKTHR